jgi:hypothetical protein
MPTIIAIDPGLSGAIAVLQDGQEPVVVDAPTFKAKDKKEDFDIPSMVTLLKKYATEGCFVVIERVHAMPRNAGSAMFNFGRGVGLWEGILAALGCEVHLVTPQKWKTDYEELSPPKKPQGKRAKKEKVKLTKAEQKALQREQDRQRRLVKAAAKAKARELAAKMYPNMAHLFAQVNHDGRAEAVLMACYGRNHLNRS